jgi:hypothetical protein
MTEEDKATFAILDSITGRMARLPFSHIIWEIKWKDKQVVVQWDKTAHFFRIVDNSPLWHTANGVLRNLVTPFDSGPEMLDALVKRYPYVAKKLAKPN